MKAEKRPKFVIGIDEAGRGPIAGPVAVGGFVFLDKNAEKLFRNVKESKQLSESQREKWFKVIEEAKASGVADFHVEFRSEKVIDNKGKGLTFAIKAGMKEVLKKLKIGPAMARVLLDGGLKAPVEFTDQTTIIKGDEKVMVIALASICAKVLRDRKMRKLSRKHPTYGFETNKGYGTKKHYSAIQAFGMLPVHRRSFLRSFAGRNTPDC